MHKLYSRWRHDCQIEGARPVLPNARRSGIQGFGQAIVQEIGQLKLVASQPGKLGPDDRPEWDPTSCGRTLIGGNYSNNDGRA